MPALRQARARGELRAGADWERFETERERLARLPAGAAPVLLRGARSACLGYADGYDPAVYVRYQTGLAPEQLVRRTTEAVAHRVSPTYLP